MSGYGNLVMIDHHNGLATAYAHQSRIAVACNQNVNQGDVIGYSGCTGFCTGFCTGGSVASTWAAQARSSM